MSNINYSIIIPHHNSPSLLNRCLESIPYREDIEIIVVDDNSSPNLQPVVNRRDVEYLFISERDSKGAGHARNIGLKHSKGKWVLFADCDDFFSKDFIIELDNYVLSNYDVIFFDAHYGFNLQTNEERISPLKKAIEDFLENPHNLRRRTKLKHIANSPWFRMVKKDYIEHIGASFHEVPVCNDGWFSHYIAVYTDNIYAIDKKLYYWVDNPSGMTNKIKSYSVEKLRVKESAIIRTLSKIDKNWNPPVNYFHNFNKWRSQLGLIYSVKLVFWRFFYNVKFLCRKYD